MSRTPVIGVLVITGGGRGIGRATARLAAARGWQVCLGFERDEGAAQSVVRTIAESGGRAVAMRADVRREQDVAALFDAAENAFLVTFVTTTSAWIGLNDIAAEGTFVWANGSTATYRNWQLIEPNSIDDDCVLLSRNP